MTTDWRAHLARFGARFVDAIERHPAEARPVRIAATERDPLAFALVYLRHHLTDDAGEVSLAEPHVEWCHRAAKWADGPPSRPAEDRHAYVAPRETGKSTWWFLVLPMWAAAHGHVKFAAAFADSGDQAQKHLATFKHELDANTLLRHDYPDLCAPRTRRGGTVASDNQAMYQARSGFVFAAKGIDSSNLGMKVGAQRPDLLILDDIEPGESNYSAYQAERRLGTLVDVVLPLSLTARVVVVGTVTMPDSIVHQMVKAGRGEVGELNGWVAEEGFQVHHHLPTMPDGRSVWPQRWPVDWLASESHKRSYAKNFLNDPMGADGGYWTADDFRYGDLPGVTRCVVSVDPAVTTRDTSDFTGIAVVSYAAGERKCLVREALARRLPPAEIRAVVVGLVEEHLATHVLIESNQGGDLWGSILHDMPVKVISLKQTASKEVRAAEALNHYQRGRVLHARRLPELEAQMAAFPKAPNDDMVDAVGSAVNLLLRPPGRRRQSGASTHSYV